ncbi:MAG TPA: MBOAT family O-acyltransferase [Burkholderiaceae bacterium]|nr:MBOAT family O-acyltransferase [Burkholderiaceae bacterium]
MIFFTLVVVGMRTHASWRTKKAFLLVSSYVFYAVWNPPFVLLLWFSTAVDWWLARRLAATEHQPSRKALLCGSLLVNLGLLAFFKYGGFVLENVTLLLARLGIDYQPPPLNIVLPVGISFYTFQTLSYTIDVYRQRVQPCSSFLDFALFVTFFPQLVAGPIVRASDFLPQTATEPVATHAQVGWGLSLMVLGLFEKVVLADGLLAPIVEAVYDSDLTPSPLASGTATLAFAGQIFCDFAGYSTIAIGASMVLGFWLPDNFRFPYAAIGFSDFWRRWHISLSSWLRDYLYVSLGGNRGAALTTYRNLMLTMLLGGLWHGASWNFVIWGGLHGLYLIAERVLNRALGAWHIWRTWLARVALCALTFGGVCFAWVFFRAPSLQRSLDILRGLLPDAERQVFVSQADVLITATVMAGLLTAHWMLRDSTLEHVTSRIPVWVRVPVLALMLLAIFLSPGEDRAFIYFQF